MLISELDVGDPVPLQSQIARITDNEKIGINISNRGRRTLVIEKTGTSSVISQHMMTNTPLPRPSYRHGECVGQRGAGRHILQQAEIPKQRDRPVLDHFIYCDAFKFDKLIITINLLI